MVYSVRILAGRLFTCRIRKTAMEAKVARASMVRLGSGIVCQLKSLLNRPSRFWIYKKWMPSEFGMDGS